jgi:hypothetical protein
LIVKDSKYQRPDQRKLQVKSVEKRNFHDPWRSALKEQKLKDHKNLEQKPNKEKKKYIHSKIRPEKIQNSEEKRGLKESGCKSKSSKILYY